MPYKTILVYVDRSPAAGPRVGAAVDLARRHDAVLIGLTAAMPQAPFAASSMIGVGDVAPDLLANEQARIDDDFATGEALFRQATADLGGRTEWHARRDLPVAALSEAGNAADLIVIGRAEPATIDTYAHLDAGELLLQSGRPVLIVPPGHRQLDVRTAIVAWKSTPEARRAISDALPMLERAEHVILLTIDEAGAPDPTVSDAQSFLLRHGIDARVERIERKASSVEDTLVQFARNAQADLIVAGAYGHTRIREWVFGGVTRQLLMSASVPCILSH